MDLLQIEAGKARYDAFAEAAAVAVYARYISRTAPKVLGRHARQGVVPIVTKAYEVRHPRGVVGLVTAWNYPAVFAASDGYSALVGGNAVVHRPDVQAALSAIWVRDLAVEAGLPEDLWQIVLGPGRSIGTAVVDRADAVAFTGSTAAGRAVAGRTGSAADLHGTRARRQEPVHRPGRRRHRPCRRGRHPGLLHQRRPDLRRPRADPGRRGRSTTRSAPSSWRGWSGSGWAPG